MKIKSFIILLIAITINFKIYAQIPSGYYNTAEGLTGSALRTALHNIIDDHTTISYDALWNAYYYTDRNASGKIWDIYSTCSFTHSSDQCGSYSDICDCYNREHTVPQDFFGGSSPMVSDLFHVLPTDGKMNGYRSNYPYGECDGGTTYTNGLGKLGNCTYPGYTNKVFEPADEYKGDVARIYFYMATRYMDVMSSWSGASFSSGNLSTWTKNMMLEWHYGDPVSQKEIDRNNVVYTKYQHNRNPFVDHPEYVCEIWGTNCPTGIDEIEYNQQITIYPNPAIEIINIEFFLTENSNVTIDIYDITGRKVANIIENEELSGNQNIEWNFNSNSDFIFQNGIYFINLKTENFNIFEKIIYSK